MTRPSMRRRKLAPGRISLKPGSIVYAKGRRCRIDNVVDMATLVVTDLATGLADRVPVTDIGLEPTLAEAQAKAFDLAAMPDSDLKDALRRYAVIEPFVDAPRTKKQICEAAAKGGVSMTTVYNWLRVFENSRLLTSLVSARTGPSKGRHLLEPAVEAIIKSAIEEVYLTKQRHRAVDVIQEVRLRCRKAQIPAPHGDTVRNRLRDLPPASTLRRRGQRDKARDKYQAVRGQFPGANSPLAVVQIDHSPADIVVVDDKYRRPMGRPWITLAIDVYSRMVVGLYMSMDAPSALGTGLCVSQAILPKEDYLAELKVDGGWPVWGFPRKIHTDNAKEFRGAMLARACAQHHIALEQRPAGLPNYGGHIERLMGVAAGEFRKLPGATFNSPKARKGYDSDKEATLTLRELEQHFLDFIINVYHRRDHSSLGMPPIRQWEIGLHGTPENPGSGLPDRPADPHRIRLDFLPFEERTVQRAYGLVVEGIHYYDEALDRWIGAVDPEDPKHKRQFTVRYDPRDMSRVYFFDPKEEDYIEIPYRNLGRTPATLWEIRDARKELRKSGRQQADEAKLFEAIQRGRQLVEESRTKTKQARRDHSRAERAQNLAKGRKVDFGPVTSAAKPGPAPAPVQNDPYAAPVVPLEIDAYSSGHSGFSKRSES